MATKKRTRSITSTESLRFLKSIFSDLKYVGANFSNHKKTPKTVDVYQITIDKLSDEAIGRLIENDKVLDVYYCPSMPPSGMGYGIDLRFKLFVRYDKVEIKSRKRKTKNDEGKK